MVHAKISVARLRAPMTFKFSEVASFVVKDNSYYALPSASTANENRLFKRHIPGEINIEPTFCPLYFLLVLAEGSA